MNKVDHLTSLLPSLVLVLWGVAVREFWRNPQYHSSERRPTYEMSNIPKPTLPKTKQKKCCIWMNFSRRWYRIESVTYVNIKLQILAGLFIFKGYLEYNNILIISEIYSTYLRLCRVIDLPSSCLSMTQCVSCYDSYDLLLSSSTSWVLNLFLNKLNFVVPPNTHF